MAKRPGNDALQFLDIDLANHGVGLTTASLAIGENSSIIAEENIFNKTISSFGIDQFLG